MSYDRAESSYVAALRRRQREVRDTVVAAVRPVLDRPTVARVRDVLAEARGAVRAAHAPSAGVIADAASAVDRVATTLVRRAVASAVRAAPPTLGVQDTVIRAWARQNVALIRSIDTRYLDEIERVLVEAVRDGAPSSRLADLLAERYGVARTRAELIAVDQIGTLQGQVTRAKHLALGIMEYTWTSRRDDSVRPTHRLLHGTIRRWSEPHPTEGHPGTAIRCRCIATPVIR